MFVNNLPNLINVNVLRFADDVKLIYIEANLIEVKNSAPSTELSILVRYADKFERNLHIENGNRDELQLSIKDLGIFVNDVFIPASNCQTL